jgi:hypothetical protein
MEISGGISEHNFTPRKAQRCSGVYVIRRDLNKRSPRRALPHLLACRNGLRLRVRGFQAKNCFAFLHQIKAIASDRFQIAHVGLEQSYLAGLARQQILLLANQLLQVVDFVPALHQFFVRRHEQAHDDKPDGNDEQDEENAIKSLPDGGFATRAKISVTVLHFSGV